MILASLRCTPEPLGDALHFFTKVIAAAFCTRLNGGKAHLEPMKRLVFSFAAVLHGQHLRETATTPSSLKLAHELTGLEGAHIWRFRFSGFYLEEPPRWTLPPTPSDTSNSEQFLPPKRNESFLSVTRAPPLETERVDLPD
jgi:hypothetical protein